MLNHLQRSVFKMKQFISQCEDCYGPMNYTYLRRSLDVVSDTLARALFPKSTIKPQLPQPQVTVTLGAF